MAKPFLKHAPTDSKLAFRVSARRRPGNSRDTEHQVQAATQYSRKVFTVDPTQKATDYQRLNGKAATIPLAVRANLAFRDGVYMIFFFIDRRWLGLQIVGKLDVFDAGSSTFAAHRVGHSGRKNHIDTGRAVIAK
jgi:hypothetical protein